MAWLDGKTSGEVAVKGTEEVDSDSWDAEQFEDALAGE